MIDPNGILDRLPSGVRLFLASFLFVLSIGFFTGLQFVGRTNGTHPEGIETNYLGNEDDPDAEIMIFRKSEREMLTIIHTHILSMSLIFFLLGGLVWLARLPRWLKLLLTIEPFASLLLTFGGVYFLWKGALGWKYIVLVSGTFMTASFALAVLLVLLQLYRPRARS